MYLVANAWVASARVPTIVPRDGKRSHRLVRGPLIRAVSSIVERNWLLRSGAWERRDAAMAKAECFAKDELECLTR